MRLLFLLPHVPATSAHSGGARSTGSLIAGLSARHDVAVLCLRRLHDAPIDAALRNACVVFEAFDTDAVSRHSGRLRRMRQNLSSFLGTPRWVMKSDVPELRDRLRSLLVQWKPDIVHLGYQVMGQYARELAACPAPRVLTVYEPGFSAASDAVRGSRGYVRLRRAIEKRAWARYERAVMREADVVVVLTERDRRELEGLAANVPLIRIPLGIALPDRPLNPVGTAPHVLFIGNFIHRPNVDAALWLMRAIFPQVRRTRPDARLLIIGPGASTEMRVAAGESVTLLGTVESVNAVMDAAAVVVAPLRRGGGMRVKVMEALAAGKPVVATALAVEGLSARDGSELRLAEDDSSFASSIVRLLDHPEERLALARRAREWAVANLGWERSVEAYETLHDRLVSAVPDDRLVRGWRRVVLPKGGITAATATE